MRHSCGQTRVADARACAGALAAILLGTTFAFAQSDPLDAGLQGDVTGLHFCAPPQKPACFADPTTFSERRRSDACQNASQIYLRTVAAYRLCLVAEVARAVLDLNQDLERLRCSQKAGRLCPPVVFQLPKPEPEPEIAATPDVPLPPRRPPGLSPPPITEDATPKP